MLKNSKIRLVLQFQLETTGPVQAQNLAFQKQVIVELDTQPFGESSHTQPSPVQVINETVASIMRALEDKTALKQGHSFSSGELPSASQEHPSPKNYNLLDERDLTPRELQVVNMILQGATNPEMAMTLGISPNTIKFHVKNAMRKLQVRSRIQLATQLNGK